jgi:hypothetical protein
VSTPTISIAKDPRLLLGVPRALIFFFLAKRIQSIGISNVDFGTCIRLLNPIGFEKLTLAEKESHKNHVTACRPET